MRSTTPPAPGLLKRFLRENGLTQAAFARAVDVSDPTASDWISGAKAPRFEHRAVIARWTNGAVPIEAWESPSVLRRIAAVAPYAPPVPAAA